jgi:peptide/nickel transport system permease protein
VQYAEWLGGALRGDFGRSIQYDVPVGGLILSRLRVTLPLTLLAGLFMTVTALPLGMYAATHHRRLGDYVAMVVSQLGIAIPGFWAGLLLILLFAVRLRWVEAGGFAGWEAGAWAAVRSLLLPAVALGVIQAAILTRTTRAAVLEVIQAEHVRTARAKGLDERAVTWKHVFRNALITIVTIVGLQLGQLMAGAIVLENVFYLPGLGRLALGAISARDLPVVQGVVLFVASLIVTVNFAVDIVYGVLDPRIRYE